MKKTTSLNWYNDAQVTCSCGNKFTTGSSQKTLQVDICSQCHPFFTGEMKFVDRQGRVDKFKQKMKAAQARQAKLKQKQNQKKTPETQEEPKSYQEILRTQQRVIRQVKKTKK